MTLEHQYEVARRRNERLPDNLSLAPRATRHAVCCPYVTHASDCPYPVCVACGAAWPCPVVTSDRLR